MTLSEGRASDRDTSETGSRVELPLKRGVILFIWPLSDPLVEGIIACGGSRSLGLSSNPT